MIFIIIKVNITKNTIKTNLLNFNAPPMSPWRSRDIPLVRPQAGQLQFAKIPSIGHVPLNIKGSKKCLKTHFTGEYFRYSVGTEARINRIDDRLNTFA